MFWSAWNWFWNLCTDVESIAFALAAVGLVLSLAWGKNGLKKLSKKHEALAQLVAGWAALVYLGLLAFTITIQVITYLWRLLPSKP